MDAGSLFKLYLNFAPSSIECLLTVTPSNAVWLRALTKRFSQFRSLKTWKSCNFSFDSQLLIPKTTFLIKKDKSWVLKLKFSLLKDIFYFHIPRPERRGKWPGPDLFIVMTPIINLLCTQYGPPAFYNFPLLHSADGSFLLSFVNTVSLSPDWEYLDVQLTCN